MLYSDMSVLRQLYSNDSSWLQIVSLFPLPFVWFSALIFLDIICYQSAVAEVAIFYSWLVCSEMPCFITFYYNGKVSISFEVGHLLRNIWDWLFSKVEGYNKGRLNVIAEISENFLAMSILRLDGVVHFDSCTLWSSDFDLSWSSLTPCSFRVMHSFGTKIVPGDDFNCHSYYPALVKTYSHARSFLFDNRKIKPCLS